MSSKFSNELDGQIDFYQSYLSLINKNLSMDEILSDNTDGVLNGNLIEFKLNINDLNAVLFQAIKYLSVRRIKGKPVPANIVLISLNDGIAYVYDSGVYLTDIEKVYMGGASKNNTGFSGKSPKAKLKYRDVSLDEKKLIDTLREKKFTKINIDENNIVGWATNYYKEYPTARKSDFIGDLTGKQKIVGEIRKPNKFKDYILPYNHHSNARFNYLMDKLNDDLQKKNLGAFYTHEQYAKKSLELVREAIKRVPEGNDYIILDRCAGTGNLEIHMTDEELSHVIVSTLEYYEYKVLLELLGDKVKYIIPPTEKEDTFNMGMVKGADALSKEFIDNEVIKSYVDDPKITMILLENPPFAEVNGITRKKSSKKDAAWKDSYVGTKMKDEVSRSVFNDLSNHFIWSAFKYYLRQPTDSYIVYSPVKYWKSHHLVNKKFIDGFAFNRKHFHAKTSACITVALWSNEDEYIEEFDLKAFDIIDNELNYEGLLKTKKVFSTPSKMYDKRKFDDDELDGIETELSGLEKIKGKKKEKKYNENLIGYLVANGNGFDNPRLNSSIVTAIRYDGHGFYLRNDNFLEKLPLFAAGKYTDNQNNWKIMSFIMRTSDGLEKYKKNIKTNKIQQQLLKILLWTSLTNQSHMRSLMGSDGRYYKNELCLDNSFNKTTLAIDNLKKLKINKKEKVLFDQWFKVLDLAQETSGYDPNISYGAYQIEQELNTYEYNKDTDSNVYHYPELNGQLKTLKSLLKQYYISEIAPFLFEYEFLK